MLIENSLISADSINNSPPLAEPTHYSLNGATPILEIIEQQAVRPPGGDHYIGGFYSAISALTRGGNNRIVDLLQQVYEIRPMTPEHHTNLLFRAVQSVFMKEPGYPNRYTTSQKWIQSLIDLVNDEEMFEAVREALLTKDTTTTVYQRYAGERALMTAITRGKPTKAVDLGCGGNYGLPGMSIGEEFKPINDNTPNHILNRLLSDPFSLEEGLAIDREDPYNLDAINWRHSCGFYPTELESGGLQEVLVLEERLSVDKAVRFYQGDLLALPIGSELSEAYYDFVLINTMLYQLQSELQAKVIQNARKLLKPNGKLFIQDFAFKDTSSTTKLCFEGVEWGVKGNYRLFATGASNDDEMFEVFKWNNGRCRQVAEGEDFQRFFSSIGYNLN